MLLQFYFSCIFLVFLLIMKVTVQLTFEEELTLSYDQKVRLDEFRTLVVSRLPHDYMKEDIYLVRWLRVNNFNVPAAERMLLENIKWRENNNIDNILNEDWSDFDNEYRISVEGCDKQGRPVVSTIAGEWDMRKAVVTGKTKRMMRYTDKLLEEGATLARKLMQEGHNVTQFVQIYDMSNFNLVTHGCPQCIAIYAYNFQSYEKHYPLSVHKSFSVNTPDYFHAVFQLLSPILSKHTRDIVHIYGKDKKQWQEALLRDINENNLTKHYGGRKNEAWDIQDVRQDIEIYQCKSLIDSNN